MTSWPEPSANGGRTRDPERERQHDADAAFCAAARTAAQEAFERRGQLVAASKAAWASGDKAGAKRLSEEAKAAAQQADALSLEAAKKIFALKNAAGRVHPLEVDLHGLEVVEALGFAKSRLVRPHLLRRLVS